MRLQSVLKKTIVFITHDFDEAIRLADRIAIMKDGEIIQIGTPEELVMQPGHRLCRRVHPRRATAPRSCRPAASCSRPRTAHQSMRRVDADAKIASFAAEIVESAQPFAVSRCGGKLDRRGDAASRDRPARRHADGSRRVTDVTASTASRRRTARRPRLARLAARRWRPLLVIFLLRDQPCPGADRLSRRRRHARCRTGSAR